MIGDIFSVADEELFMSHCLRKRAVVAIGTGNSLCIRAVGVEQLSIKR